MANSIEPIVMPKWGLAMTEGMLTSWSVEQGSTVTAGDEICEIETTKLANMFESPVSGVLRRLVAKEGEELPVGALIAVAADTGVQDDEIDAFVAKFQESFVPEETEEGGPEPETIMVNGRKLVYLKLGDGGGPPVVLLHGFGADMNGWLFNHGALAEHRTVYALDLPGHGKSIKDVGEGSLASLASTLESFLDEIQVPEAHLVGHSMGAGVALQVAANGKVGVASLVLIDAVGLGKEINNAFLNDFIDAKRQKHLKPVLQQLVSDKSLISTDMMEDVFKFKRIDGVVEGLRTLVAKNFGEQGQQNDLRSMLQGLSIPVTVIWGHDDEIIPVAHCQNLPEGVKVEIIEDVGHIPQMENAARVNEIILSMVRG